MLRAGFEGGGAHRSGAFTAGRVDEAFDRRLPIRPPPSAIGDVEEAREVLLSLAQVLVLCLDVGEARRDFVDALEVFGQGAALRTTREDELLPHVGDDVLLGRLELRGAAHRQHHERVELVVDGRAESDTELAVCARQRRHAPHLRRERGAVHHERSCLVSLRHRLLRLAP